MGELAAWGDESVRTRGVPEPRYFVGVSLCRLEEEEVRKAFKIIMPRGARKMHWMIQTRSQRRMALAAISKMSLQHIIVSAPLKLHANNAERARRKCLEYLMPLLENKYHVRALTLESREASQDGRDITFAAALRAKHYIDGLHLTLVKGDADARLWIPDQVLGAFGDSLAGAREYDEFVAFQVRCFSLD